MKIGYLDLFCGLSGDITLGCLVDAGLPFDELRRGLSKLGLKGVSLSWRRVLKHAVSATKVDVTIAGKRQKPTSDAHDHGHEHDPGHGHTSLKEILALLRRSGLPAAVKASATECFLKLGEVEGRIHGIPTLKVQFHEVGAMDSIVDITGACLGFHLMGIERLYCSAVPVARGELRTHHGLLPNPGPAAMGLLTGFPLRPIDLDREILTPTGAALLATFVKDPGVFPAMTLRATGWGAGEWDIPERANVARLLVGDSAEDERSDLVWLVETNLDNATGELVGHLFDRLFGTGALDVWTTPIQMKKSRPGVTLSVLVPPGALRETESLLLRETPTFGLRRRMLERSKLERAWTPVRTRYGTIRMKTGSLEGETLKATPEYEDCRAAAERHEVPLSRVIEAAREAWRGRQGRQ